MLALKVVVEAEVDVEGVSEVLAAAVAPPFGANLFASAFGFCPGAIRSIYATELSPRSP